MLFGHRSRGKLPILAQKYQTVDRQPLAEQRENIRQNQKRNWDKHAKEPSIIRPGTKVNILQGAGKLNRGKWVRQGVVVRQGSNLDEYLIEGTESGATIL